MDLTLPLLVATASLLLLVLGLALALILSRQAPSRASRQRNAVAQQGEGAAEVLLQAEGFRVLDRQVTAEGSLQINGEDIGFTVRLDLLVEREGCAYIAEVKTGSLAPDPMFPATRRQLREYAALLPDHGVLLVDMESGTVTEVAFE